LLGVRGHPKPNFRRLIDLRTMLFVAGSSAEAADFSANSR
jgi:hypothetical protein